MRHASVVHTNTILIVTGSVFTSLLTGSMSDPYVLVRFPDTVYIVAHSTVLHRDGINSPRRVLLSAEWGREESRFKDEQQQEIGRQPSQK